MSFYVLKVQLSAARSGAFQDLPLGVPLVWLVGLCSGVVWSQPLVVLVLGTLGRGSGAGWYQMLQLALSYLSGATKQFTISDCLYRAWVLYGRGQGVYKDWFPPSIPQGVGSIEWGDQSQENRASGSLAWRQHDQALSGGKVAPTPEHIPYSNWVSDPSSLKKSTLLVQAGIAN